MKNLVIIESPNKVQTIQKYLGKDYVVTSSVGHFLKMKKTGVGNLGIDFSNWEPLYSLEDNKKDIINKIKELVLKSDIIYVATDPDREGEAIAENLVSYFKIENRYRRLRYNEITKESILNSLKDFSQINYDLVNSQKARRMVDRIIGFKCSGTLRKKIKNNENKLSSGRVQTIFLKIVIDREDEILNFVPIKYSLIEAKINNETKAKYFSNNSKFESKEWVHPDDIDKIFNSLKGDLEVLNSKTQIKHDPKISPLKQASVYKKLPYSSTTTQRILQKLFEGFGDSEGLISYPRTDSTRLSATFLARARAYVKSKYGENYIATDIKGFAGTQDAHEAIRPTNINLTPWVAKSKFNLSDQEYKVYKLIYETTLRAIMSQPKREIISYVLENNSHQFKLSYSKILFDGYLIIEDFKANSQELPKYEIGEKIKVEKYLRHDTQTKPPSRYTEGSIIAQMDELKIGRPSTYASMILINIQRNYFIKEANALIPTKIGRLVLGKLLKGFPKEFSENYTAILEKELEEIAEGKVDYKFIMEKFWRNFNKTLETAEITLEKTVLIPRLVGRKCPLDSAELIYRKSKKTNSEFIGCFNFPNCNYSESIKIAKKKFSFLKKLKSK